MPTEQAAAELAGVDETAHEETHESEAPDTIEAIASCGFR